MKKILTEEEINALSQFTHSGATAVKVMRELFDFYIKDLESIRNVDPKSNVGLHTVARQHALNTVEELRNLIFEPAVGLEKGNPQPKPISQYR